MRRSPSPSPARLPSAPRVPLRVLAGLAGALLAGCQNTPAVRVDWRGGPFFHATNFTGVDALPVDVLRVAVLPPAGLADTPADPAAGLETALRQGIAACDRFETVFADPKLVQAVAGRPALASTDALPPELFDRIARESAADAVLLTDITLLRSYPPLALGVRAKLVRLQGNRAILWAFDQVFDCRNPAVANSAQLHAAGGRPSPVQSGAGALQSPSRFAEFVFATTFATLPQRQGAPAGPVKVPRRTAD